MQLTKKNIEQIFSDVRTSSLYDARSSSAFKDYHFFLAYSLDTQNISKNYLSQ